MTKFNWKQLLSEKDPIGTDSPFYVSDLPFTQKMAVGYSSIKLEDKEYLRLLFKDKIVVDLGCGNPKQSTFVREFACNSKSQEYVGIDLNYPKAELFDEYPGSRIVRLTELCQDHSLQVTYLREDMLVALQKLESCFPGSNYVFVLVGIETAGEEGYKPLAEVLSRLCSPGGVVLLGPGTHGISLEESGFKLERRIVDEEGGVFFEVLWKDGDVPLYVSS